MGQLSVEFTGGGGSACSSISRTTEIGLTKQISKDRYVLLTIFTGRRLPRRRRPKQQPMSTTSLPDASNRRRPLSSRYITKKIERKSPCVDSERAWVQRWRCPLFRACRLIVERATSLSLTGADAPPSSVSITLISTVKARVRSSSENMRAVLRPRNVLRALGNGTRSSRATAGAPPAATAGNSRNIQGKPRDPVSATGCQTFGHSGVPGFANCLSCSFKSPQR